MIKLAPAGHCAEVVSSPAIPLVVTAAPAAPVDRLTAMFHQHVSFVWRSLRRLGVPDGSVDDASQEVFIVAARHLERIATGKEKAYLFGVAIRVAADARRSQSRRRESSVEPATDSPDPGPSVDQVVEQRRARQLLEQILNELPDDTRPVFILYELEGLTMAEIASFLELAPGTVASRLRRGRDLFTHRIAALQAASGSPRTP